MLVGLIRKEVDPLMEKINELLELYPEEGQPFRKYRDTVRRQISSGLRAVPRGMRINS